MHTNIKIATRFIGLKEFRQSMARIAGQAARKQQRLIILKKNRPVFELRPLSSEEQLIETLLEQVQAAQADVKTGRVYSLAEVKRELGLD